MLPIHDQTAPHPGYQMQHDFGDIAGLQSASSAASLSTSPRHAIGTAQEGKYLCHATLCAMALWPFITRSGPHWPGLDGRAEHATRRVGS